MPGVPADKRSMSLIGVYVTDYAGECQHVYSGN